MMPRGKQKKTMSGAPGQNIKSVPGQRYGEAKEQRMMQEAMPAPNEMKAEQQAVPQQSQSAPQQSAPAVAPAPQRPVNPQEYLGSLNTGLLQRPATPNVPVTNGLRSGPGINSPTTNVARNQSQSVRMLQQLYKRTDDPLFLKMLNRFN